ncbi:MAG TPA: MoaD/ThiS family protein [Thermomicrobiales bacterium]|nr:MoaD/ThiS family protein [Thermomicrobiales bacterium]
MTPPLDAEAKESEQALTEFTVELFGVPRLLIGRRQTVACGGTLAELVSDLAARRPVLLGPVIDPVTRWLVPGYSFVVNERFTSNAQTALAAGNSVLLVSSVAGG